MGRMYETMTEIERLPTTNHSFRNLEDARTWLGLCS